MLFLAVTTGGLACADERVSFAEPTIIPRPKSIVIETNRCVKLAAATPVRVACLKDCAAAVLRVETSFKSYFGFSPSVETESGKVVPGGDEAYRLTASADGVKIEANTVAGVGYALSTLRQSAIAARGTLKTTGYILPGMRIEDAPALSFRGIHFCWFPGVTVRQMERYVRMAAYYKFNYVVIEPWGVFKWQRHPAFCWPDASVTADDMRRLARLGRELGVILCPQLNVFGHAAMSRFVGGKHATLDFGREYEPVFEPLGGWNWCLSNPETRRIIFDMADELVDAFGNPPYFHIGCDEAEKPSCPTCRAGSYAELVNGHITAVHDHLAERGVRSLMWHDMLLDSKDEQWKNFYARGDAETATMVNTLPRDIVICDWFYYDPKESYPTLTYFKEKGFETLTCPWMNLAGIAAQAKEARRIGLKGILATTWNRAYGRAFAATLIADAHAGWGTSPERYAKSFGTIVCAGHLRQIGWDMGLTQKEETGFVNEDVPAKTAVGTVSD